MRDPLAIKRRRKRGIEGGKVIIRRHGKTHIISRRAILGAAIGDQPGIDRRNGIVGRMLLLLLLGVHGSEFLLRGELGGVARIVAVHALLRENRVCQGGVLVPKGLGMHTAAQVELVTGQQGGIRAVDSSTIGEDMGEGTLRAEFAVSLAG